MVDTHSQAMSGAFGPSPAPAAPRLLQTAPIMAVLLAVSATVGGMLIIPLGDPTPLFVLLVCLHARRWQRARSRLLDATASLAGIMAAEWMLAYAFLLYAVALASSAQRQEIVSTLGLAWLLYVLELLVLVTLFGVACSRSRSKALGHEGSLNQPI